MKKTARLALLLLVFALANACKKEEAKINYNETLKDTFWYGNFKNNNENYERLYGIELKADNKFMWHDPVNSFPGTWAAEGDRITFKFTVGGKDEWNAQIKDDNLSDFKMITQNSTFTVLTGKKASAETPQIIDTQWLNESENDRTAKEIKFTSFNISFYENVIPNRILRLKNFSVQPELFIFDASKMLFFTKDNKSGILAKYTKK